MLNAFAMNEYEATIFYSSCFSTTEAFLMRDWHLQIVVVRLRSVR